MSRRRWKPQPPQPDAGAASPPPAYALPDLARREPCALCGREARGFGYVHKLLWGRYPHHRFCSKPCLDSGSGHAARNKGMIDKTDMERIAIQHARTRLAEALTPRRPVWATLSTKGLERVQIPGEVAEVIVFADHDESGAGMRAAQRAVHRLKAEGRRVTVAAPPVAGNDANDLLLQGGVTALEAALERGMAKVEDEVSAPAEAPNEDQRSTAIPR